MKLRILLLACLASVAGMAMLNAVGVLPIPRGSAPSPGSSTVGFPPVDASSDTALHEPAADDPNCIICHANNLKEQHVDKKGLSCNTCHGTGARQEVKKAIASFQSNGAKATCSSCHNPHPNATQQHTTSALAPGCSSCHTSDVIRILHTASQTSNSTMYPSVCYVCHANPNYTHGNIATGDPANRKNSNCFTCHGSGGPAKAFAATHFYPAANHTAGNTSCFGAACHTSDLKDTHGVDRNGDGISGCSACHRADFTAAGKSRADCLSCHSGQIPDHAYTKYAASHNSSTGTGACVQSGCHVSGNLKDEHFTRTRSTGESFQCSTCHASSRVEVQAAIQSKETGCKACHGPSAGHSATHQPAVTEDNCLSCHADNLKTEHIDNRGKTCGTCHSDNARQEAKTAIANFISTGSKATCDGCHADAGNHAVAHQPALDETGCATCHADNLTTQHVDNKGLTCGTCHGDAVRQEAKDAIAAFKSNGTTATCSTCHSPHTAANQMHTSSTLTPGCAGCHASDVRGGHDAYQRQNPSTYSSSCAVCHANPNYTPRDIAVGDPESRKSANCFTCHGSSGPAKTFAASHSYSAANHIASNASCFGTACHVSDLKDTHSLDLNNNGIARCSACHRADFSVAGKTRSDCLSCHAGQSPDHAYGKYAVRHNSSTDTTSCVQSGCHVSGNIKDEHFARTPSTGGAFQCSTCHASSRPEVQAAIQNDDTGCSACHGAGIGHTAVHQPAVTDAMCTSCHVDNLKTEHVDQRGKTCETCHSGSARQEAKDAISSYRATGNKATCTSCHANASKHLVLACITCHGPTGPRPVASSGQHTAHFSIDLSNAYYGDATDRSTTASYTLSCGICHPLDSRLHSNGTVNVELKNDAAPEGSLKDLNTRSSASYTAGNCANTYCHSNAQPGSAFSSATMRWSSGSVSCTSCHGFPPPTGRHSLHVGIGFPCYACHNATVSPSATIADKSRHVNGAKDVVFSAAYVGDASFKVVYNQGVPTCAGTCHSDTHDYRRWTSAATVPTPTPPPAGTPPPGATPTATPGLAGPVIITGLSPSSYQVAATNLGGTYFADRSDKITVIPTILMGENGIKTASGDNGISSLSVRFNIDRPATVYVGYPASDPAPAWLQGSFQPTNYRIYVSDSRIGFFQLWAKDYAPGTVSLGDAGGATAMYILITKAK